jgi:RNA 2',3'-cyclic 3'-phosphodiesterase
MNKLMRLFIAVDFSNNVKDNLYHVIQDFKKHTERGSFTHKENLHLTLAFIGETKDFEQVKQAMDKAVLMRTIKPFTLNLRGLGRFKRREGDIYYINVEKNDVLWELNRTLTNELKKFEFKMEEKEYKPHLTLGRRVIVKRDFDLSLFDTGIPKMTMDVNYISLMKSERIDGKLVYTEVYRSELHEK